MGCYYAYATINLSAGSPWNLPGRRVERTVISGFNFTPGYFNAWFIHDYTSMINLNRSFATSIAISQHEIILTSNVSSEWIDSSAFDESSLRLSFTQKKQAWVSSAIILMPPILRL